MQWHKGEITQNENITIHDGDTKPVAKMDNRLI